MPEYQFLHKPPRFLFFTGKGGVGKTSIACATALKLAEQGLKVLLVSTDPASNVGQVFGIMIGNQICPMPEIANLFALEIDPQAAAAAYRHRIIDPVKALLPATVINSIEEQLSGACTTEIAAFDEFTGLLTDPALSAAYDHIVFDTAPTGHTIRMLQLPGAWSGFLATGKGDASCLGPLAGLAKQSSQYKAAVAALADPKLSRLILVARAQTSSLREVARTHQELAKIGLSDQYLLINGILPNTEITTDPLAMAIWTRESQAIANLPASLKKLACDQIQLKAFNLVGISSLRQLFSSAEQNKTPAPQINNQRQFPPLSSLISSLAEDGHGLVMVMGKGGVGKTTIAAAIAVALASRGYTVHLSTSDPAAHLAETLMGALDNLTVSRIDPKLETERYRQQVLSNSGHQLDSQGLALLEEDLRSPCTEEIAVFQAFSRIIQAADHQFVIMDTAPTGHTLLLLDATGAYHREVNRQINQPQHLTPLMQLQDPKQTKIILATLAETTPVLEAAHLQTDLRRAGIEPWAWLINNSIAATKVQSPLLQQRAANELAEIDRVANQYSHRYAVLALEADEPVGIERLLKLSQPQV